MRFRIVAADDRTVSWADAHTGDLQVMAVLPDGPGSHRSRVMRQEAAIERSRTAEVSEILRQTVPAVSPQTLRGFACLCVRRIGPLLDERLDGCVDIAERVTKGEATMAEAKRARSLVVSIRRELQNGPASRWHAAGATLRALHRIPSGWADASAAVREAARERGSSWETASVAWAAERAAQATLLLSIIDPRAAV